MTTNGTLLSGVAEGIVDSGLDWLGISLDGPEAVHDRVRGVPGTFRKAIEGAHALQEVKRTSGRAVPEVTVIFTLAGDNYRYAEEMIGIATDIGATCVTFSNLFFWTEDMVQAHNALYGDEIPCYVANTAALDGLDPQQAYAKLEHIAQQRWPVAVTLYPVLTCEEMVTYYKEPTRFVKTNHCIRPWLSCLLLPNGDVIPCLDYVVGNVKVQSFSEIWNGERFRHFRRLLRKHGTLPGCARCCGLFEYQ